MDEKEKGIAPIFRGPLRVGHFVHLRAPSSGLPWPFFASPPPPPFRFASLALFRRLPSFFFFFFIILSRCLREAKRKGARLF